MEKNKTQKCIGPFSLFLSFQQVHKFKVNCVTASDIVQTCSHETSPQLKYNGTEYSAVFLFLLPQLLKLQQQEDVQHPQCQDWQNWISYQSSQPVLKKHKETLSFSIRCPYAGDHHVPTSLYVLFFVEYTILEYRVPVFFLCMLLFSPFICSIMF